MTQHIPPILDIIGTATQLKKVADTRGGEYAGPCPFCGGTDRFRVQPSHDQWWCRKCSPTERWQSTADYVMRRDGVDFKEAMWRLEGRPANQPRPHVDPEAYPAAHGCTWDDFARWRAKLTTFTESGKTYRAIAFPDDTGTRYRLFDHPAAKFKPEKSGLAPCWYGLKQAAELARQTGQPLIIVNGQPSVIACQVRGIAACTIPGGENNIAGYLERGLLANLQAAWDGPIVILLDGDDTGYKAAPRVARVLAAAGYTVSIKDAGPGQDAADICRLHNGSSTAAIAGLPTLPISDHGSDHPSDQQVITPTAPRFTIAPEEALMDLPPIRYLDRDLGLVAKAFHLIYGASGSGKTFFAIERAMRQVAQGRRVLYIATEDTQGLRYRIAAWRRANPGVAGRLTWLQMPEGLDLQDYNQVAELVEAVEPYQYDHIILDTLREAHSGDENSSQDTRRINRAIQRLVAAGAAIDVVHHTGVSGERPRGSTALFGNADAVIKVEDDDGYIRISFDKLRNAPPRDSLLFGMVQQDTGLTDTDGEPVISVVLRPANQTTRRDAKLSPIQRKVLQTLALSIFDGIGAKAQQVIDTAEITRRNTYLALASLKTRGFISQGEKGDPYMITPAGRAQIGSDQVFSPSQSASDQSDQQVITSDQHTSGSEVITSDHTRRVITRSHTRTPDDEHSIMEEPVSTGIPPDPAYRVGIPTHRPNVNDLQQRQIEAEALALAAANPDDDDEMEF